jgi:hypothetical protein
MVNEFAVLFCELIVGILLATLSGAFILKVSCALYNLLAGVSRKSTANPATGEREITVLGKPITISGPEDRWEEYEEEHERIDTSPGVPIPRFEWAMRILFFATLINTTGSFIVLRVARLVWQATVRGHIGTLPIFLVASPLGMLVLGGICAAMLPTRFGKGMLVSLLFHLLVAVLAAIIVVLLILFVPDFNTYVTKFV